MERLHKAFTSKAGLVTFRIDPKSGDITLYGAYDREYDKRNPGGTAWKDAGNLNELGNTLKGLGGDGTYFEGKLYPGQFHPRIWRGVDSPLPEEAGYQKEFISSVRSSRLLFRKLENVFSIIEPDRAHDPVFGLELRELVILACTEVESAWKSVLLANGAKGRNFSTKKYVKLLEPMRLKEWEVRLNLFPDYGPITPFETWEDKEEKTTKSLAWYDAYNKVKHNRESALAEATFGNVVNAMAALFILTIAQFGTEHLDSDLFGVDPFYMSAFPEWREDQYTRPLKNQTSGDWLGEAKWTSLLIEL